ncbi:MAG: porin [Gammaproteobacteria bacterium]|nr:porin [Gammaproteobacteria bacterium]
MNKRLVAAAVASALALPMAAHAVKFKTSGQVNRALEFNSDGEVSSMNSVDADSSSTRFRFTGSEDMGNGITAGVNLEIQVESNSSADSAANPTGDVNSGLSTRHANVYFAGNFGKVTLGQGSDATDGMAFADLNNGAWMGGVENACDFGCAVEFRGSSASFTGVTVGDVVTSYDGGRRDMVRYDTPAIGPLVASVSVATDSRVEGMLQAAGPVGGAGQYDLRGGYQNTQDGTWVISGAFKANQGTSIQAAYGAQSYKSTGGVPAREDGTYYYVKLGHDWGNNSVAIDYRANEDSHVSAGCTAGNAANRACGVTAFGVGFAHSIPRVNVDFYASWKMYTLEDFAGADDVNVFVVGSRIKFD